MEQHDLFEQKIREMANDICRVKLNCNSVCDPADCCEAYHHARKAVEVGYRKVSPQVEKILTLVESITDQTLLKSLADDIENLIKEYQKKYPPNKWIVENREDDAFGNVYSVCRCPCCGSTWINAEKEPKCVDCGTKMNGWAEENV